MNEKVKTAVKTALKMCEDSRKRMNKYSPQEREELERMAWAIIEQEGLDDARKSLRKTTH